MNIGYSNHNLGIVVKNHFQVALEWKPVDSLWCCGHMTHTRAHTNLFAGTDWHWISIPTASHRVSWARGMERKGQSLLPASETRWKEGQSAAELQPWASVMGLQEGEAPLGEVQAEVFCFSLYWLFCPLAAGNGNVSFLNTLSVLSSKTSSS